jgi:2-dehydropantoate 2-reductase
MDIKKIKIAIYGAGAMGTVLGSLLTKGGLENVHLITRNQAHVNGLNDGGAKIVCQAETLEWTIPVKALTPSQMTEQYDVVFLMTKQRQNEEILNFLLPYLADDGVVCTTQNGLPEASVAAVVGNQRAYGAVTTYGATFLEAGKVALTSKLQAMRMSVCGYENDNTKSELLVEILSYAGKAIDNAEFADTNENLQGARWSKLAINAAFSGLSVVTGCTFGTLAKRHKSRKVALGILRECFAVAKALGVTLEKMQGHDMKKMLGGKSFFKRVIAYILLPIAMKKHKKLYSGMLKDIQKGRRCEIDFINGVVVDAGKTLGVPTPYNQKIVEITHGIENGLYEISLENLDFFNE